MVNDVVRAVKAESALEYAAAINPRKNRMPTTCGMYPWVTNVGNKLSVLGGQWNTFLHGKGMQ